MPDLKNKAVTLDSLINTLMSQTRRIPSVELHTEFSKEAASSRDQAIGWNEALAHVVQILRTTRLDDTARCIEARNRLNEALEGKGAVVLSLEEAVDLACRAIARTKVQEAPQQQPEGLPYGIIDPDYARAYTIIRNLAWQEGYAIGLHGSFTRDLDLIAVPWTATCCSAEHLVARVMDATGLKSQHSNPGRKPHDRLVWTLLFPGFSDPRWVDLSIMTHQVP